MADRDIVDIGFCVIKQCSMYAKEYKAWIAHEAIRPTSQDEKVALQQLIVTRNLYFCCQQQNGLYKNKLLFKLYWLN